MCAKFLEVFIYRYHLPSVCSSPNRICVFYQESRLRPFSALSIAISRFTLLLPSDVRPFRLAGGCGGRRLYFPLFLLGGGDLIQVTGFGFVCSVSSYRIDVFFSPFLPLNCLHSIPVPLFLLPCLSSRINCALAHPSLSLLCPNPTLHVPAFSEDGPPCTRKRTLSSFDYLPELFIFV